MLRQMLQHSAESKRNLYVLHVCRFWEAFDSFFMYHAVHHLEKLLSPLDGQARRKEQASLRRETSCIKQISLALINTLAVC